MHRHIELVAAGVLEQQELGRQSVHLEGLQPQIAADAVVLVHHGRADLQIRELTNDSLGIARRAPPASPLTRAFHAELGGRDDA